MFKRKLLLVAILLYCSGVLCAQGFLQARNGLLVDGQGKEVILRGVGLGGWMLQEPYMLQVTGMANTQHQLRQKIEALLGPDDTQAFYDAWLANHCTKADIDSLAAWGFNSVRLPMHFNLFTPPVEEEPVAGEITWRQTGFDLTDSLLQWCKANHLYLILDLHAAPGGQGNDIAISDRDPDALSLWQSEANRQKTIALWQKLAQRYAHEPWIGGYDLINETNWGFETANDKNGCAETLNQPLKELLVAITKAIREVDRQHLIFIEGNCWANNYKGIFPLWDDKMVVSFHKYWNYNDQASIRQFVNIRNQYKVPLWLGESGENSNAWFTDAISLLEKNKIGWSWWPLKKLGNNNPLQIKSPDGYRQLLAYWRGEGEAPDHETAKAVLMQLAANTRAANNSWQKDVTDAMFRQVNSTATLPFQPHVLNDRLLIYAVDYDLGRSGYAYHDNDSANYRVATGESKDWNSGHQYRNDGVDIEACSDDLTNGYNVGWIGDGEWMQYTVQVQQAGRYQCALRYAAAEGNGVVTVLLDGKPVLQDKQLAATGGYKNWQSVHTGTIALPAGSHRLCIKATRGGFNLNYLELVR